MRGLLRQFWLDLLVSKHYLIASLIVFIAGWVLGATDADFAGFLQGSLEGMGGIAKQIAESNHPQLYLFIFIMLNNVIKTLLFIFMGAFLGIWPLAVLLINGMMLGYALETHPAGSPWLLFLKGILPHGILEIPAIIIACAYGVRFGGILIKSFFMLFSAEKRVKAGPEIMHFLTMTLPLMAILTVALFIAAIIESTLTYQLMS